MHQPGRETHLVLKEDSIHLDAKDSLETLPEDKIEERLFHARIRSLVRHYRL